MSGTYLHLGGQYVVPRASVAGIFDIDNTTSARSTREMLAAAEKNGEVINAAEDLPRSFVLCEEGGGASTSPSSPPPRCSGGDTASMLKEKDV